MTKIIISGCNGKMGQMVTQICEGKKDVEVVAGFDVTGIACGSFPVYANPKDFKGEADVMIDFSNPAALNNLLDFCTSNNTPCVFCTTGYSGEQLVHISHLSEKVPAFRSGNMSLGINLLTTLVKKAAAVLGDDFDVEIVEKHHNTKVDAPSGTALMLADAAASALPHKSEYVYDRQSVRQKRGHNEIGILSVRGGTIVGEHEVIFAGQDEVIELKHTAYSRNVFANGAVAAAIYLANIKQPGMYDMNDVLADVLSR